MTAIQAKFRSSTIEGIKEPIILRYFDTLNASDFTATANLFAPDGALHPPFEEPVIGREAIASYLVEEAIGMQLNPHQGISEALGEDSTFFNISGKVQTPLFSVNVAWKFILTAKQEIASVEIKLLASPQELLNLRR